ncbi:MAG: chemotaxis response regulator protein-glutamate methylesterase [Phycisphaerales bacterium]
MQAKDSAIRIVAVDDNAIWRRAISEIVSGEPDLTLVGAARDGREAVEMIERENPDVVTLDVEMPGMTGHEVLSELKARKLRPRIIMVSSTTDSGASATIRALALGAVDFVTKPSTSSPRESIKELREQLLPKVRVLFASMRTVRPSTSASSIKMVPATSVGAPTRSTDSGLTSGRRASRDVAGRIGQTAVGSGRSPNDRPTPTARPLAPAGKPRGVVIGVSTGGPAALTRLIPNLPGDFRLPICIVQHMPPKFTKTMAADLNRQSELDVVEAEDGMVVEPGRVLIAPGGRHMTIGNSGGRTIARIDDEDPIEACRPAVEKLFASSAELWGGRQLVVMLTGMGHDGRRGCTRLHELGAPIICQSPESCVVFGMPSHPVAAGQATSILDLDDIAPDLVRRSLRQIAA